MTKAQTTYFHHAGYSHRSQYEAGEIEGKRDTINSRISSGFSVIRRIVCNFLRTTQNIASNRERATATVGILIRRGLLI
jgi:hypothetical protein